MSKLDEIIKLAKGINIGVGEGWEGFNYITDANSDKEAIKSLFLEIVDSSFASYSDTREIQMVDKVEVKRKIYEL